MSPLNERDIWFGAPLAKWLHPSRNKDLSERDVQRSRVYAAEYAAFGTATESFLCDPVEFVDTLLSRPDFQRAYGSGWRVLVSETDQSMNYATGANRGIRQGRMQIPRWGSNPFVLCHELAHCIVPNRVAHGPLFAFVYLDILSLVGMDGKLYDEFFTKKVRTTPWE